MRYDFIVVTFNDFNHNGTLVNVHINGAKMKQAPTIMQLLAKFGADGYRLASHSVNPPTNMRSGRDHMLIFERTLDGGDPFA